jgi:hypothetical protein
VRKAKANKRGPRELEQGAWQRTIIPGSNTSHDGSTEMFRDASKDRLSKAQVQFLDKNVPAFLAL